MITLILASLAIMVIHCSIWFEQKSQFYGLGGGGFNFICNIYFCNVYAEFDSKIAYKMFYMIINWPVKYQRYKDHRFSDWVLTVKGSHFLAENL